MDDLMREFLTETSESLDTVDNQLVRFEQEPNNAKILDNIFRLVHTIKGTCGFLGLPRLEALLGEPGLTVVAVGAGHMLGPDGLIALLEASGHPVRSVCRSQPAHFSIYPNRVAQQLPACSKKRRFTTRVSVEGHHARTPTVCPRAADASLPGTPILATAILCDAAQPASVRLVGTSPQG